MESVFSLARWTIRSTSISAVHSTASTCAVSFPSGTPGVLTSAQEANDRQNFAPDSIAGYNVNTIAIEVPINKLTQGGAIYPGIRSPCGNRNLGDYLPTSGYRPSVAAGDRRVRRRNASYRQVQRMGNPLINEVHHRHRVQGSLQHE